MIKRIVVAGVIVCAGANSAMGRVTAAFLPLVGTGENTTSTLALAISPDGLCIVGVSEAAGNFSATRWSRDGIATGLQAPDGYSQTAPYAVSEDGETVVGISLRPMPPISLEATKWSSTSQGKALGFLGINDVNNLSFALGVSGDGSVFTGFSTTESGKVEAFSWTAQMGMAALPEPSGGSSGSLANAISRDGQTFAGSVLPNEGDRQAAIWFNGEPPTLVGALAGGSGADERFTAISLDESTFVGYGDTDLGFRATRWTGTTGLQELGTIAGFDQSLAVDVNGNGTVVIGYTGEPGSIENSAFYWTEARGMLSLDAVLNDLGLLPDGWRTQVATGISDDGHVISGYGINPDGVQQGFVAVIPGLVPTCAGDSNGNGLVTSDDLTFVVSNLGAGEAGALGTPGDVDGDGLTTTADITLVVSNLGLVCE